MPSATRLPHISRLARFGVVMIAFVVTSGGWTPRVFAHSFLVRTSPASGSRLTTGPDEIVLDFSEPIDGNPEISLRTAAGRQVDLSFVGTDAGNTRVRTNVPALAGDVYVVTWQVMARDGHTTEGEFAFAVGNELPTGTTSITSSTTSGGFSWVDAITQFEIVAGLAFAVGGLISERFIWRTHRSEPASPQSPATPAIAVALVGVVSSLAIALHRRHALLAPAEWSNALDTRSTRLLLAIGVTTWLGLVAARAARLRPMAFIPLAASFALLIWRGHSGDDNRWWATPVGVAHVMGGGIWAGALLHLTRSTTTEDGGAHVNARDAAHRYSKCALVVVPTAIALGTVVALTRLEHPAQLWTTRYGQILIVKLILVGGALVLANHARRRDLPFLEQRWANLRAITRVEVAIVTAVLAVSVALATTAPPTSATSFILGPPPLTDATWSADLAGNNLVLVAAVDHQLQVRVLQPGGQPPPTGRAAISGQHPSGSDIDIAARTCGPGCEIVNHDWQAGTTTLSITINEGGYAGGTAHLRIQWPPGPDATQLLTETVAATRAATQITLSESVTSDSSIQPDAGTVNISGADFISQEPFANGGDDVHQLAGDNGLATITFTVPASNIWVHMWIDPQTKRIAKETIIDPGHRIEHTLTYSP